MDVGGQAVIEGVMMRSPKFVSTAVRDPKNKIIVKTERYKSLGEKYKILKIPFLRGIISMYEMMKLGIRELIYSGNIADEDDGLSNTAAGATVAIALLFALGLFVLLPYILTTFAGISEDNSPFTFNLVDGIIKLIILVVYIAAITLMDDVKRVFQYHGAEHKAVNCYEHKKKLTVSNVRKFDTIHHRCGTSFIVIVFFIMLVLFSVVPSIVDLVLPFAKDMSFLLRRILMFGIRLIFLFPVISISYEVLKLSNKYRSNPILGAIAYPGRLIQKMTTKEPDDSQLEVAISALKSVLKKESKA